ncbi:glycoside hydrolase family 95 protein [Paenibacillus sp. LMG 31461]|uniref:Glycoside hydrolase family 95 protein n=1 Tax=Paenibacillus plantarum TaxID=2654975 RepID=A0ABX1X7L9_9BACL|nr:glycoside hydrolase family 95 protein [Paenibacillus plantarum]NOU64039.1 glycoside hydrolase family 95 protein [Paenibacillus plantarum]
MRDNTGGNHMKLWYRQPAEEWVEALPVGNGRLGGMVYGGIKREQIALNEDTLWSGTKRGGEREEPLRFLEESRKLIFEGRYSDAQAVIEEHMLGPVGNAFQAMGDLEIVMSHLSSVEDYRRELDLRTGLCQTEYVSNGVRIKREVFVSAVDQVMAVRFKADRKGAIGLEAALTSRLNYRAEKFGIDRIILTGAAPSLLDHEKELSEDTVVYEENKGIQFQVHLQAILEGGTVETHGGRLVVKGADAVTLLLTSATSFNGFDRDPALEGLDPRPRCDGWLNEAAKLSYVELRERHIADITPYFDRVKLELDAPSHDDIPTDERIAAVRAGQADEQLTELFFQFGRYLMISASRPGTQPTTLQGIWNNMTKPPWSCNYTTNINTQMNYWPAEVCNLAEFHEPLFDLLEDMRIAGERMAKAYYNCQGWASHHNVDLWRNTSPSQGSASWAYWPMGGVWLCQHLWEHYAYGVDQEFLRNKAYPIMKEAAMFCLDYLVEDGEGNLVSVPSTSPENTFIAPDGQRSAVSMSSTMDIALMRELFTNCIEAARVLEMDAEFRQFLKNALERLLPLRIGQHGQLQEWYRDFDEAEPGHRHTAHLYPLHPGNQITVRGTPELAKAARVSLDRRRVHEGEDTIGWCYSWNISIYARLEDAERAHSYLTKLLGNPFPNLFNAHRHPKITFYPLTIEANFAASAGIAELLMQSHAGELNLLPALPKAWPSGRISGIRARGGYELDLDWADGKLRSAAIRASQSGRCQVRTAVPIAVEAADWEQVEDGVIAFTAEAGRSYTITADFAHMISKE